MFKRYLDGLTEEDITVILFGSRTRGEQTALSDYDLLIIRKQENMSSACKNFDRFLTSPSLRYDSRSLKIGPIGAS